MLGAMMMPGRDKYQGQFVPARATEAGQPKLNDSGRISLPPAALQAIDGLQVVYPLQFRIDAPRNRHMFAGILEFNAEAGTVVLPDWMYDQMGLRDTRMVRLETVSLPTGTLIKLRPHEIAFVMLSDPRALLERQLVKYPVLTRGATIVIHHIGRDFRLDVADILDERGNSLEAVLTARADAEATELKLDFERPLDAPPSPENNDDNLGGASSPTGSNVIGGSGGVQFKPFAFKPPTLTATTGAAAPDSSSGGGAPEPEPAFVPFSGTGRAASGKAAPPVEKPKMPTDEEARAIREKRLQAFSGQGRSLR